MNLQERYDSGCISSYYSKDGSFAPSSIEELKGKYPFITEFFEKMLLGRINNKIAVFKNTKDEYGFSIALYTANHEYYISVRETYLGCVYDCRYREPLEDWHRGRDLSDGKCTPDTLKRILASILYTELVEVVDSSKPPMAVFESNGTTCPEGLTIMDFDDNEPTVGGPVDEG